MPGPTLHRLLPLLSLARQTLEQAQTPQRERHWLERIVRLPDSQPLLPPRIQEAVFEAVSTALYQQRWLELHYRNAKGNSKEARVMPLGLVQQGVRLYLVVRFAGYDNQRILALPRIRKAILSEDTFDLIQQTPACQLSQQLRQIFRFQMRIAFEHLKCHVAGNT